jgi:tripartite-type tricarboxylate transporter receptor subunit TctC
MIKFIRAIALSALPVLTGTAPALAADAYPSGPVRLVVPFSAGGGTDNVARAVALGLSKRLGQQLVVDNRPGAGGSIGTMAVTQATADGLTLLLGSNGTMVLNPLLYDNLKYKVETDLVPVGGIASVPYLIATNPQFDARDVKSLLEQAKSKPGTVTFASPGRGTTNHLAGVLLETYGKVSMTHVPYRGASPAMNDVVGGLVNFMSGDIGTLLPMVKGGKLRPIAVTGKQRVAVLPDVPTVAETLPGFEATGWFGIFAPKGTPKAVVDRLHAELGRVLADPEIVQRLESIGGAPMLMDSDALKKLIASESGKWKKVITDNKITADALQ